MLNKIYLVIGLMFLLACCTTFEEAEQTDRKTFVHFYSSGTDYFSSVAELDTDQGYIISGQVRNADGITDALVIKTDSRGRKVWQKIIPKGVVNAIQPLQNGYILIGDSIQRNAGSAQVHELENTYARLILMDAKGNIVGHNIKYDSILTTQNGQDVKLNVDYHGDAVALDPSGNIIVLGSFRIPGQKAQAFVSAFSPDISNSLWNVSYISLDYDFVNCNTVHVTPSANIAWATKMFTQEQNVSREFLSLPHVGSNSVHISNSTFGSTDTRNYSVEDFQKSSAGYCAIGTYSETSGLNANMYFVRIDANFKIIPESARYIDGQELLLNNTILDGASRTVSVSYDEGMAITATDDGYVLAGTLTSTPAVGNGGKDILLVKVDPFGNLLWKKLLGGTGDETVSSIRVTPDNGLLIFGTNTINGLSSMMLLKTDQNGEITN